MTIDLANEIIASSYDKATRVHSYTIERGGRRWTVKVPDADFQQYGVVSGARAGLNQGNRRRHLGFRLTEAMAGAPDA